ncbi:MAG: T9SS type A sorting domain-containing protein [bacterium]|nr:T9SS type A sorting domain-containing protein [bacterium]
MRQSVSTLFAAVLILVSNPARADFTDEFNDGVIDPAYWASGGLVTESGGLLNLNRESPADFIMFTPELGGDWTLEVVIRLNSIVWNDSFHGIALTDDTGLIGAGISFGFSKYGKLFLAVHNSDGNGRNNSYGSTGSNAQGDWQTWTFQRNGDYLTISVDGTPIGFGPAAIAMPDLVHARLPGMYSDGDGGAHVGVTSSSVDRFVYLGQGAGGAEPWSWIDCTVDTHGSPAGVVTAGDFAYVASSGLQVIDISDPRAAHAVGIEYLSSTVREVAVAGDYAYVSEYDLLSVIDITDPANPLQVGHLPIPGRPQGVAIAGNHACIANSFDFQVVDISDPTVPQLAGNVGPATVTEYWARGVAVSGNHAFVAGVDGLLVIDITDPGAPAVAGSLSLGASGSEIMVIGNTAYVCADDLVLVDISNPANPQEISRVVMPASAEGVSVVGNLAYVGASSAGVQIIDLSNPFMPQLLGGLDTPGLASDLCVAGDYVLVADESYGLQIMQVSNELGPDCNANSILDVLEMAGHQSRDWNDDGILDSCQQGLGLSEVPPVATNRFALHEACPNPFNPQTTISFDLPRQTRATLRVYDVTGRLVRTLLGGGTAREGRNEVVWNGLDAGGRPVSSGVYFYVLEAGEFTDSKRMVLTK